MRRALRLAQRACGDTSPNPMVGAVIVRNGRIVGSGYHRRAGWPHAEVEALRRAGARASGATLYVTLEPCTHTGRTPPCCEAVIRAGVKRVVIAAKDPNPLTNGRGIARLRRAGLRVTTGVLEAEAKDLNAPFTKWITKRMPWVVAKIAQSLDGKIATRTGQSRWISSAASRVMAHRLRRQVDAVVVGVHTVLHDDPRLSARDPSRPPRPARPLKVIVDSRLRTPIASRCLSDASAQAIIATTSQASRAKRAQFERRGVRVLVFQPIKGRVPLRPLFQTLARRFEVMSVLVEGGSEVLASAFRERLVDRVVWLIAPMVLGGRTSPSSVGGEGVAKLQQAVRLSDLHVSRLANDLVVEAAVEYPR